MTHEFKGTLENGAAIIASHSIRDGLGSWIILAKYGKEFVTWIADSEGNCCWGHYFRTPTEASVDYDKRLSSYDVHTSTIPAGAFR